MPASIYANVIYMTDVNCRKYLACKWITAIIQLFISNLQSNSRRIVITQSIRIARSSYIMYGMHWHKPRLIGNSKGGLVTLTLYNGMIIWHNVTEVIYMIYIFIYMIDVNCRKYRACKWIIYHSVTVKLRTAVQYHFCLFLAQCRRRWDARQLDCLNLSPQSLHEYGFSPVCISMCLCMELDWLNFIPHTEHSYGCTPLCIKLCLCNDIYRGNCFPHVSQVKCFSDVCVVWCSSESFLRLKALPHVSQL